MNSSVVISCFLLYIYICSSLIEATFILAPSVQCFIALVVCHIVTRIKGFLFFFFFLNDAWHMLQTQHYYQERCCVAHMKLAWKHLH